MQHLSRALAEAYGLRLEAAEPIDFGIWEQSWSVRTDRGRLFAKRFRRKMDPGVMLRGLELSQALRTQGIPAPAVIPARDGGWVAEVEGERYFVSEWVDGAVYHPGDLPLPCAGPFGAVLGRFHALTAAMAPGHAAPVAAAYPPPAEAAAACRALLARFEGQAAPFAAVARAVLAGQIDLLERLDSGFPQALPVPTVTGPCFHSFWVEQVLFRPDGTVAALVDWTDGTGGPGLLAADLDGGIHLSSLDEPALRAFVAGYQSEHPLPEAQWRGVAAYITYGHLASTNFLWCWLDNAARRNPRWEMMAERWHRPIAERFRQREAFETAILEASR